MKVPVPALRRRSVGRSEAPPSKTPPRLLAEPPPAPTEAIAASSRPRRPQIDHWKSQLDDPIVAAAVKRLSTVKPSRSAPSVRKPSPVIAAGAAESPSQVAPAVVVSSSEPIESHEAFVAREMPDIARQRGYRVVPAPLPPAQTLAAHRPVRADVPAAPSALLPGRPPAHAMTTDELTAALGPLTEAERLEVQAEAEHRATMARMFPQAAKNLGYREQRVDLTKRQGSVSRDFSY